MKIAIDTLFEHATEPSSAIDYLVNLGTHLPAMAPEHDFYLLVSARSAPRFEALQRSNLHLVDCFASNDRRTLRILAGQTVVPWRMHQLKIDLLFSAGNVCPWAGDFCRVLKINTLHHYRTPAMIGRTRSLYRRFAFQASANRADAVMANSAETRNDLCRFLGLSEQKVKVVWEAVDECFLPASTQEKEQVRARFGLQKPYLLFSSTLWPYKNAHTLLRAFGRLCAGAAPDVELVFAGRPGTAAYQGELEAIIAEMNIAGRVRFLGFVPNREMPQIYSAATAFVYPSLSETFGKPLVEAMRCGLPVIASNSSCIPEIAGEGALLVNPENVEELAEAMRQVLTNPDLRRDLIARGTRRGAAFSWQTCARQTLDMFATSYVEWQRRRHPSLCPATDL